MRRRNVLINIIAILAGSLVVFSGLIIGCTIKNQASSGNQFIAEYGGYGLKGEWETLGTASADLTFEGETSCGSIILGANQYLVMVTEQYVMDTEEGKSIVYEDNLTEGEGSVRFAHYEDVLVGEIEVGTVVYSFGVAETLDSARHILDQYNDHLQEESENQKPFRDVVVPDDRLVIPAFLEIDPDTINLKAKGDWITAYIEISETQWFPDVDSTKIDIDTVKLNIYLKQNNKVSAENSPAYAFVTDPTLYITDHDGDGKLERMAKFNLANVQDILQLGDGWSIEVTGSLNDGRPFYGLAFVKVH